MFLLQHLLVVVWTWHGKAVVHDCRDKIKTSKAGGASVLTMALGSASSSNHRLHLYQL